MPLFKCYIPKHAEGYEKALHYVQRKFCTLYGGFTSYEAKGGWQQNGRIQTEPVTVVTADYSVIDGSFKENMFRDEINPVGKGLRERMPEEESILIVVDGEKFTY